MTNKFSNASKPTLTSLGGISASSTDTLTNKTFDANGTGNSLSNVDLSADVTGVAPVANGGTGVTASNTVIQRVSSQDGAVATGTTVLPIDDTIPQNTEGNQFLSLSITPKNTSNILRIDVVVVCAHTAVATTVGVCLFQDSVAGALAGAVETNPAASFLQNIRFTHTMSAGTTSSTTFKVRAGAANAGTITFNGNASARLFGGIMASSIIITEYAA